MPIVIALAAALAAAACNVDSTTAVEEESRLGIASLFAINGSRRVSLGWTAPLPPSIPPFKAAEGLHDDGPGASDPENAGTPLSVLVYRGGEEDFQLSAATLLAEVPAGAGGFIDYPLVDGQTYYYRVVPVGALPDGLRKTGRPSPTAVGRPYDYEAVTDIRYGEQIQRIFTSGCAVSGCHTGARSGGQFSLKSWEDLLAGGDHGAVAVAFRPDRSHLFFHINNDTLLGPVSMPRMPPSNSVGVPRRQVELVRRWIAEGCRNDVGAIPFTECPEGRVLVTNQAEDLVAVVDRSTNLAARYIRAGAENTQVTPPEAPHNVTVDAARGVYYVNLIGSGKVLKYRLADNELVDQVGGIISPTQVAISSTGDTAYVAQFSTGVNSIKVLRTNPMQVVGEVSAPNVDKPHGVQITPDGRELWVTGNLSDNILVVDLGDFSTRLVQLNNQPPGQGGQLLPYQTAMTPDNAKVYVTNQRGNTVTVVDRRTYEVIRSIPVGLNPLIPSITPDGRRVLVPNRNTEDLSVIDTETDQVAATIAGIGPQPHGSAVTPDGRFAYVSCENVTAPVPPHHPTTGSRDPGFITIIDLGTMSIAQRIETGAFAAGVAITDR